MATNFVAKLWQNYLPPALIAPAFRNGMGYRYLNMRISSENDASISCKNRVNFGPVNPEKTELICEFFYHMAKNGIFSRISQDILDQIFTISSPYESTLSADDRSMPRFPICQGTLPWQSIDSGKMS